MEGFYKKSDIVIDPIYGSLEKYALKFDYDLLGHKFPVSDQVYQDPLQSLANYLEKNNWNIKLTLILIILVTLALILCISLVRASTHFAFTFFYGIWKIGKARYVDYIRGNFCDRDDLDLHTLALCQTVCHHHNCGTIKEPTILDILDYEAIRFVFQQPWLANKLHKELQLFGTADIWNLPVDGELKDLSMDAMNRDTILAIRKATSARKTRRSQAVPSKFRNRSTRTRSRLRGMTSAEAKELLSWERLYDLRVFSAAEGTYAWYTTQQNRLPVEAAEEKEKLRQFLTKMKLKQKERQQRAAAAGLAEKKVPKKKEWEITAKQLMEAKKKKRGEEKQPMMSLPGTVLRTDRWTNEVEEVDVNVVLKEFLGGEFAPLELKPKLHRRASTNSRLSSRLSLRGSSRLSTRRSSRRSSRLSNRRSSRRSSRGSGRRSRHSSSRKSKRKSLSLQS